MCNLMVFRRGFRTHSSKFLLKLIFSSETIRQWNWCHICHISMKLMPYFNEIDAIFAIFQWNWCHILMKLMPYLPYFSEIGAIFAKFQVTYFPEMYTFKVRFEFQNVIPSSCQTDNLSRWLAPYWVIYYSKTWEMIKMVRKSLFELISKYLPTTHTCETWPLTWPICQCNWW